MPYKLHIINSTGIPVYIPVSCEFGSIANLPLLIQNDLTKIYFLTLALFLAYFMKEMSSFHMLLD